MPYRSRSSLQDSVKNVLPAPAQDIYQQAFNSAWDEYSDKKHRHGDESREAVAHKVAWSAVKHQYQKGDDDQWHKNTDAGGATRSPFTPPQPDTHQIMPGFPHPPDFRPQHFFPASLSFVRVCRLLS